MTASTRADFRQSDSALGALGDRVRANPAIYRRVDALLTLRVVRLSGIVFVSSGFVLAVVAAAATNAWTSDDVFVQNILRALLAGAEFAPVVGGDNFSVKVPLYLLISAVLPNGGLALTVTVLAVNVPLIAALLLVADRAAAPRGRLVLAGAYLLSGWFLVSRIAPMSSLMIPNGRNGEIGVIVLLMLWWAGALRGRADLAARVASGTLLAMFFFSDGFFTYVVVGSALLVSAAAWLFKLGYARRAWAVTAGVLAAAGSSLMLGRLAASAGLDVMQNYVNATPAAGDLPNFLGTTLGSLARNFNADTTGRPLNVAAMPAFLQVFFFIVVLALVALTAFKGRAKQDLRVALGLAAVLVNVVLYVATSNASDPYSFRYVLFAAVLLLLLAIVGLAEIRRLPFWSVRSVGVVAAVAIAAVLLNVAGNGRTVIRGIAGHLPPSQARTEQIIRIAEQRGLSLGAGDYWDGNITDYWSSGRVRVVPQDCSSGHMVARTWLANKSTPVPKSDIEFVVIRSGVGCTSVVALATFGRPLEKLALPDPGDAVWIYQRQSE